MGADFSIYKSDDDRRLVFGWASIAVRANGTQIEDWQGDVIDPEDLEDAVYEYVLEFRDAGEEHQSNLRKKGKLVESVVFTKEKMKAMGIPEGIVPEGWWIGFKVKDDDAWAKVKSGQYSMFSIEGSGVREPMVQKSMSFNDILKFNPNHGPDGRFTTGSAMGGISRRTISGGGISINIRSGREPKSGYMVAVHSERAVWISASDAKDPQKRQSIMQKFKDDNMDVLSEDDNYFGTWLDPETGEISLDISKCVQDRDEAIKYASEHNEKAIWDIANMESIDTGGTGKPIEDVVNGGSPKSLSHDYEMKLTRELGELRRNFSLSDKSEENRKRGERIKEIMQELGLESKPRENRRPPRVVNR